MEDMTLLSLLEADKEMTLAGLRADRSPQAAQATLEKAVDRVALRYAERAPGGDDEAQLLLKTLKSALPLMDAVSEVTRWERTTGGDGQRIKLRPLSMGLLALGAVLILSALLGLLFTGRRLTGIATLIEAIIPAGLGMGALFFAGVQSVKPEAAKADAAPAKEEFLIDPDKVWHHLRGIVLLIDDALSNRRARMQKEAAPANETGNAAIDPRQADLFASLLEAAYARSDADSREMVENMRFYLHGAGIDVADYAAGRDGWFEFLPAANAGTIRPALVAGDRIVKKGLAAR